MGFFAFISVIESYKKQTRFSVQRESEKPNTWIMFMSGATILHRHECKRAYRNIGS
jgi:hypothetical protein